MHGPYGKMSVIYGIIMGIVMSLFSLIRYLLGYPTTSPLSLLDNIAMLVVMLCVVYLYRSSLQDKKITFKEAWLLAFYSALIGSVLYGIFMYLYSSYIDKQMIEHCIEHLRKVPEYKNYTIEQFKQMARPSAISLQSIIYNIVMAIIWAFVCAVLLKNEKSEIKK